MVQGVLGPGQAQPNEPNAYHGLVRMGHVVIELGVRTDGLPYPLRPPDSRTFIPLWPLEVDRTGIWPPARMLTAAELDRRYEPTLGDFDLVMP
jgi:hypothetical protein